ncbi:MAG: DapH/DapD/GlmU-related protein [Yoonia sp.]
MSFTYSSTLRSVTSETLQQAIGLKSYGLKFFAVGDIHSFHTNRLLSYIKDDKYVGQLNRNSAIGGVFCTASTASKLRKDITPVVVDDPNWSFFKLIDFLGKTRIYETSSVSSSFESTFVSVASMGVTIKQDVKLEEFVTVKPGTIVGDRVIIRSGAVLGLDTFQHQRTSLGMVSPTHDGDLIVEQDVEIGAQASLSKGFSYRPTIIGRSSKLDAGVYVGHGTQIGRDTIICAGAKIMGHCRIGDGAFVGPGAVVSSRVTVGRNARISLGAIVTKDVPADETVSGNFAIRHDVFIASLKKKRQADN